WVHANQIIVLLNVGQLMRGIIIGLRKVVLKDHLVLIWVAIMIIFRIIFYAFVK
ncbi:hypothetical protein LOAG_16108, partial [Loa loa]